MSTSTRLLNTPPTLRPCASLSPLHFWPNPQTSTSVYKNDMAERMTWEAEIKSHLKRKEKMEANTRAIFSIVWGQCSPMMQSKLESLGEHDARSVSCDCCWLSKETQGVTHRFEGARNVLISLDDAWSNCYSFQQGKHQDPYECLKEHQALIQALDHYGAAIGSAGPQMLSVTEAVKATWKATNDDTAVLTKDMLEKLAVAAAKTKVIAIGFLKRSDQKRHGGLWTDLENSYSRGTGDYPKDLTEAFALLLAHKPPQVQHQAGHGPTDNEDATGHSFLQTAGSDGETHPDIKCYKCNKHGHFANHCPDATPRGRCAATPSRRTGRTCKWFYFP